MECLFHFILSHLSSFSVSERRISRSFFEVVREIAEIIVAAHLAYLKNRALGIREKSFCLLYSVKYQIPMQSCAERGLHKSIQMVWMISENLRELCVGYVLSEMIAYIEENLIYFSVSLCAGDIHTQKLDKYFSKL